MKGYKGFAPGLVCLGKQYAENTVFEEKEAKICNRGMHFCENPFDVLEHYGFVRDGKINDFAEVEALDEVKTEDNKKFCTTKLRVGAKIGIPGLVKAFVEYTLSKVDFKNAPATNTGARSAATNTGYGSAATVEGKDSFAIATGVDSKARGKIGCYIAVAEWVRNGYEYQLADFQTRKVDGVEIKEDTFYKLKNGVFVECD